MTDIELVIKVDEDRYRACQRKVKNPKAMLNDVDVAIATGTVLPKGHGRLIDADKIIYHRCPDNVLDCPQSYDFNCQHCDFGISTKFRTDAIPAIIEADKESE